MRKFKKVTVFYDHDYQLTKKQIKDYDVVEDPECFCGGDYGEVELYEDNKLIKSWGDYYHDKGEERSESFVEGIKFVLGKNNVELEEVNEVKHY